MLHRVTTLYLRKRALKETKRITQTNSTRPRFPSTLRSQSLRNPKTRSNRTKQNTEISTKWWWKPQGLACLSINSLGNPWANRSWPQRSHHRNLLWTLSKTIFLKDQRGAHTIKMSSKNLIDLIWLNFQICLLEHFSNLWINQRFMALEIQTCFSMLIRSKHLGLRRQKMTQSRMLIWVISKRAFKGKNRRRQKRMVSEMSVLMIKSLEEKAVKI